MKGLSSVHQANANIWSAIDHCRSHGLACNEAAVCDQCMFHEVPCIHRWCNVSREKVDGCHRRKCIYAHKDHMVRDKEGCKWLILPGKLAGFHSDGKRGDMWGERMLSVQDVNERQEAAEKQARDYVRNGEGRLETFQARCDCRRKPEEENWLDKILREG
jgi:hypothetical protein